jgi:5-methylthioribose kinase
MSGNDKERLELDKLRSVLHLHSKENLIKIIDITMKDYCDMDEAIRELARPYLDVDGNSYDIPSLITIVEGLTKIIDMIEEK